MTKTIFYLSLFIIALFTKIQAQNMNVNHKETKQTFESSVKSISFKIQEITIEEKLALKTAVETVNMELESGKITKEEAEIKKQNIASTTAKNIENRIAKEQENLKNLVQEKVDGIITGSDTIKKSKKMTINWGGKDKIDAKESKPEKRTTSQFVLAIGANNVVTNGTLNNSDFAIWKSDFFEWGFTYNSRILKDHNLLHLKYGFSVMYNELSPTENRYFVSDNNQTNLAVFNQELKESYFKNVYLVAPLHLEFDFSPNKSTKEKNTFSTHKGVRVGLGGYAGLHVKSKQKLFYSIDDDKIRIKNKSDFNANDFIYGLSTYIGYKETTLYLKYDLNPLFENNTVDQNNISLGIRFDFN